MALVYEVGNGINWITLILNIKKIPWILFFTIVMVIVVSGCIDAPPKEQSHSSTPSGNTSVYFFDEAHNSFNLDKPATRVVVLPRNAVECLIDIGAGNSVIGVSENVAEDPRFMSMLPNAVTLGSAKTPDIEKIVSLKPEVVIIASSTPESVKNQLINLNISVAYFYCYSLTDIPSSVHNLGVMTGNITGAERYNSFYKKYDDLLSEKTEDIPAEQVPDIYVEISAKYHTTGTGSPATIQLNKIKANNIAGNIPIQYPIVPPEWIVERNPDIILKVVEQSTQKENNFDSVYRDLVTRTDLKEVSAIKNNRTYVVSNNILYGARGIIGGLFLGKIIYPGRFSDVDPDSVLHQYAEEFFPGSDDIDTVFPYIATNNTQLVSQDSQIKSV